MSSTRPCSLRREQDVLAKQCKKQAKKKKRRKKKRECLPPGRALPWRRRRRTFEVGASSCGGIEATCGGSQTGK